MKKVLLGSIVTGLFVGSLVSPIVPTLKAEAVTDTTNENLTSDLIENYKQQIEEKTKNKAELEEEYKSINLTIKSLEDEVVKLENKIDYLKGYILDKQIEIEELNSLLGQLINDTENTKELLKNREEDFKDRLNLMYKEYMKNDLNLIDVLLNSDGLFDFINNLKTYKEIVNKDNKAVIDYINLIESLEKSKKEINDLLTDIDKKLDEYQKLLSDVNDTLNLKVETEKQLRLNLGKKEKELNNVSSDITSLESQVEIEKERLLEEIERKKEEEKNAALAKKYSQSSRLFSTNNNMPVGDNLIKDELNFNGNETFLESQKSINWMKNNIGDNVLSSYYSLIDKYSNEYGVPSYLVKGLIMTESSFNTNTTNLNTNGTTDRGLMQLNSNTAPGVARNVGLDYYVGLEFIPEASIKMGTFYISNKLSDVGTDYHKGLTRYNRGSAGAEKFYSNNGTYESEYSKKVMNYAEVFKAEEEYLKNKKN